MTNQFSSLVVIATFHHPTTDKLFILSLNFVCFSAT